MRILRREEIKGKGNIETALYIIGCSKYRKAKVGREAPAPLKGRVFKIGILCRWRLLYGKALSAALRGLKAQ